MSHVVQIQTEVRDKVAIAAAATRLQLPAPTFGEAKLFSGTKVGWAVRLPQWNYPVVCDVNTGKVEFDNYEGRWGNRVELDKFLQAYAVEKTKLESRRKGYLVTESPQSDGSIKLTVQIGGAS